MSKAYGALERKTARVLDRFPRIKKWIKKGYQRVNYWLHKQDDVQCILHPRVRIGVPLNDDGSRSKPHFFGYYDKSPWSSTMDSFLVHRIQERKSEILCLAMNGKDIQVIGETTAWNYQQGSMAQWVSKGTIVYNDVQDHQLGAQLVDTQKGGSRFIPWPVQTVHPNGRELLSLNYKRLYKLRSEYGYVPQVTNFKEDMALEDDGIWRVNVESGAASQIIPLDRLRSHKPRSEMNGADHKVNHAMYSPSGARFVFMHRWVGSEGKFSRLYVADAEGSNLELLMDDRMVSHYSWRDDDHLLVWGRKKDHEDHYYLINVTDGTYETVGEGILDKFGDGHPSYSPDRQWIVTDTYPDKARQRHLLLFNTETEELIELGRFYAPWAFDGPERCDLHPRWSPDGRHISIDSAHEGVRKSYILDVDEIAQ